MRIHIVSLFPEFFVGPLQCGPTRIAHEKNLLSAEVVNPRDFTDDPHRTVDDYPFGGGAGMILKPGPVFDAVDSIRTDATHTVMLTPRGRCFNQATARRLSALEHLVLICGRYKDADDRIRTGLCDEDISIGDFVLAGGEAAALVLIESIARLLPGVVGDMDSVETDSFTAGLFDAPHYTRPRVYRQMQVPDVLVSGDHAAVARWRRHQALLMTARRRPELMRDEVLSEEERRFLLLELTKETSNGKEERN